MRRPAYTRKEKVALAMAALDALDLSATTQADRMRLSLVRMGIHALDDEQAELREKLLKQKEQ